MSRLQQLSSEAIAELFKPESSQTLITLLTVYDPDNPSEVILRLADNYTQRLTTRFSGDITDLPLTTDLDVVYGVVSNNLNYVFLPMQITLPSEEHNSAPRANIVLTDVTRYITPVIRQITGPAKIKLQLVMSQSPNNIEITFDSFYLSSFRYNADQVTAELSMIDFAVEPFPAYSFTPEHFPGLF